MAIEIVERNAAEPGIILAGIRENGLVIARMLESILSTVYEGKIEVMGVTLDKRSPRIINLDNKTELNDKAIILIDDVANSGRTMLYALKPFLDFFPKTIQTLVLVERTHKAFPINPDYVGLSIATTLQENIIVEVEGENVLGAWLH